MKKNGTECLGDLIGVDVGGTFTDLIKLDQNTGKVRLAKVASTIENQAFGVMQSIAEAETKAKMERIAQTCAETFTFIEEG